MAPPYSSDVPEAALHALPGRGRVRVTRACDRCKKRKIRCTGVQPCEFCVNANFDCTFDAAYNRGRRRTDLQQRRNTNAGANGAASVDAYVHPVVNADAASPSASFAAARAMSDTTTSGREDPSNPLSPQNATHTVSPSSPASVPTELSGDYIGPASGVSFLQRVQTRLYQSGSLSHASTSIFSFGDSPLGYESPTCCVMMSREDTDRLLKRYFDFTVPVDRFLHRPTVEEWSRELNDTSGLMYRNNNSHMRRALLFMVFALAQQHMSAKPTTLTADLSVRYFVNADQVLSKESGAAGLLSVQVRLCQCLWLLSESRINHCWNLFGTTARLALAIGLHRNDGPHQVCNYIDLECRRRTFWCAYSLDNYLSTALGRSRIFHDEDIDQELPLCVEDDDITVQGVSRADGHGQALMAAPVAYFKLGRTVSKILRDLYSIRRLSSAERFALADRYSESLKHWRAELSGFLDSENANTALFIPIFQRQRNVLNLAYWHTTILVHRPLLLEGPVRSAAGDKRNDLFPHGQPNDSVEKCLDAAMHIVNTVTGLIQSGQMFRAFWFTPSFAFSAIVVLYVYTIQRRTWPGGDSTKRANMAAASKCQDQLSGIAEKGSLAERYCLVLEGLRTAAVKQTNRAETQPRSGSDGSVLCTASTNHGTSASAGLTEAETWKATHFPDFGDGADAGEVFGSDPYPNTFLPDGFDFTEDLNSMFTSGFNGLEGLLSNDMLWV